MLIQGSTFTLKIFKPNPRIIPHLYRKEMFSWPYLYHHMHIACTFDICHFVLVETATVTFHLPGVANEGREPPLYDHCMVGVSLYSIIYFQLKYKTAAKFCLI